MDLDELLATSAPPTTRRTPEVEHELRALVVAAEAAKPRRRRRRVLIAGGAIAAVLAGTAATTYAVDGQRVIPWTTPSHHACAMQFAVSPAGPTNGGEPNMMPHPIDKARQDREVALAQSFLARFDYASIDQHKAIAAFQAQEDKIIASETAHPGNKPGEPPDGPQPRETGDQLAISAAGDVVWQRLNHYLTAHGFDMSTTKGSDLYLLVAVQGWSCDGGLG